MSKPSDRPVPTETPADMQLANHRRQVLAVIGLSVVFVAGVLMPDSQGASAGITPQSAAAARGLPPVPKTASNAPAAHGPGGYQLRCWQYGQLLFDEGPVTLSNDVRSAARLVATDRNGAAMYVTDAGHTTCLARAATPPRDISLQK